MRQEYDGHFVDDGCPAQDFRSPELYLKALGKLLRHPKNLWEWRHWEGQAVRNARKQLCQFIMLGGMDSDSLASYSIGSEFDGINYLEGTIIRWWKEIEHTFKGWHAPFYVKNYGLPEIGAYWQARYNFSYLGVLYQPPNPGHKLAISFALPEQNILNPKAEQHLLDFPVKLGQWQHSVIISPGPEGAWGKTDRISTVTKIDILQLGKRVPEKSKQAKTLSNISPVGVSSQA